MPTFTSDDRKILVRYASTLPSGSPERKAVLAGLSLTGSGSGAANAKYLDSLPSGTKAKILKNVAKHYGVSVSEIEDELTDRDAEALYEYIANDNALRMQVYRDFKQQRLAASKNAAGYARKSMRGGDYGGAGSSKQLVKDMIANMRRVKTNAERSHAVEQVQHAEAAKSITSQQAKEVMGAIGKTASARTAEDWMEDAVKRPGRLHKFFGIPEDETIPMSKIDGEIAKLKKKDDRTKDEESLLDALNLGKTFKEMKKSAAGEEHYIGDEEAGVYWSVDETPRGWFVQAWVDGGHFTHDFPKDGPYPTEGEAMEAGWSQGLEWVVTNDVSLAGEPKTFPAWARRNRWQPRTASSDDRIALIRYASTLPVGSDERKAILSGLKTAALDSVSLGEMMVSAAAQARLFYRLDMKRFVGVYEEVGQNLIRIGHTSDPDDRAFLVSEVDKGLADLKKHNITAMSEALEHMTRAYALVSKAYR